jgi:putative transcriptional regulator
MSAFESVKNGLEEALDFANGDTADAKVHEVTVSQLLPTPSPAPAR